MSELLRPPVHFLEQLPKREDLFAAFPQLGHRVLVVYDGRLKKSSDFKKWISQFSLTYEVLGGERLKSLDNFSKHAWRMVKILQGLGRHSIGFASVGGGSVGDFTGFFASVYKRGCPVVHLPTTWLSAIDSAHGGKTGLNIGSIKNQIGTFHMPIGIVIARSVLESLPKEQLLSARGELAKMALVEGGQLYSMLNSTQTFTFETYWTALPPAIEAKMNLVMQDPFDQKGLRAQLNLGHTLGHTLELTYGLPHGVAVGYGLGFAAQWSHHQGFLARSDLANIETFLEEIMGLGTLKDFRRKHPLLTRKKLIRVISEDKKMMDAKNIGFIFLSKIGHAFKKIVPLESFIAETQRQGWADV